MSFQHTKSEFKLSEYDDLQNQVAFRIGNKPEPDPLILTMREELRNSLADFQLEMMASLECLFSKQNENISKLHDELSTFKCQITDINKSNSKLQQEQCQIINRTSDLEKRHEDTSSVVSLLQKDLDDIKNKVTNLKEQLLSKEQLGRINNIEISGVPLIKNENLFNYIHKIAAKLGLSLLPTDIDFIHRVRRFTLQKDKKTSSSEHSSVPNIVVKFIQRKRKNEFISAARARRGLTTADLDIDGALKPVFINDHLAPHNKVLYSRVRVQGKELGYKYIWIKDCKIYVRKNDFSKAILIVNDCDLKKLK